MRQFPHNMCRFNVSERELDAIVRPWAREQWVDLGERKWNVNQARLTILEGPRIPPEHLSMGRGWRAAQRMSKDVTESVLAAARAALVASVEAIPAGPANSAALPVQPGVTPSAGPLSEHPSVRDLASDSFGLELLTALTGDAEPISRAWRLACARWPERPASECLSLAEQALSSLLQRRLIVLSRWGLGGAQDPGLAHDGGEEVKEEEVASTLRSPDSWIEEGRAPGIRVRRR